MNHYKPIPITEFPYGLLPVSDPSNEALVCLNDDFDCDPEYYHWKELEGRPMPGSSPGIMARKTVRDMLHRAEDLLPEGFHLRILDAYRPIAIQQFLWDYYRAEFRRELPELSDEELDLHTRTCVSLPSYNVLQPSVHNTGGAVDLTLTGPDGRLLEMGSDFDEFSEKTWTCYYEPEYGSGAVNETAANNRRMLYNVMTEAGFTNLPSEWWHFDYGDSMWAQLTGGTAMYAGVLDAEVRNMIPYDHMQEVRASGRRQQELINRGAATFEACTEEARQLIRLFSPASI